jgi:hypothetical protein
MRIKTKRRGRLVYHDVVQGYRDPASGKPRELVIVSLGRKPTITAALEETEERIGFLRALGLGGELRDLGRRRTWLKLCRQAGLA